MNLWAFLAPWYEVICLCSDGTLYCAYPAFFWFSVVFVSVEPMHRYCL